MCLFPPALTIIKLAADFVRFILLAVYLFAISWRIIFEGANEWPWPTGIQAAMQNARCAEGFSAAFYIGDCFP
jgi:hypothetical protein